ncbi:uncharacterized protein LOC129792476 [Lutzomyia longipalpis]|uniref:uncharacterized protein LOC129792476 n=1 Tax=Lutzomyia longipalpis TaxID=7200 RepID=UPI0024836F15|nr:uncharacterized protein LOC129792476 [Lutzomyia longipalpis]
MGEVPPELDTSLADSLLEHLTAGRVKEALEVTQDNRFHACLKSNCSDTIAVVAGFLKTATFRDNPTLYEACEEILKTTTSVATPQEVLLELMVLLETCEDDNLFRSVLKALQMCLLRLPENKILSIDHALEAVYGFVQKLPYAETNGRTSYTEERQKLLENGPNITRLLTNYVTLTLFLEPIREEFAKNPPSLQEFQGKTRRSVLVKFLMNLLGGSFARLHLKAEEKPVNTYTRQCSGFFVESITKLLGGDPFTILRDIEGRFRWPDRRDAKNHSIFADPETTSTTSLIVFFYVIFVGKQMPLQVPRIYSSVYICEVLLYLVAVGLESDLEEIQMKAVELLKASLDDLEPHSLHSNHLELQIHAKVFLNLTNVMIYCNSEEIRKSSIATFGTYIRKFDDEGRFLVIEKLFEKYSNDAANFRGFLTTIFKDFVAEILAKGENRFPLQDKFLRIMSNLTTLRDKEATDLVQEAEAIISTLNAIRFLAIRDLENRTEFWKLIPGIQKGYLDYIRKSMDLGRAHYEAERIRIEKGEDEEVSDKVSVNVMNEEMLPKLTRDQKLFVMNNSLMKLDLIESVLARVNECLKNAPGVRN